MSVMLTDGEKLTDLRKEKEMTLAKVAEKSGLSISTISNYENDKSSPTYDNLCKILEVYGVPIGKFMGIVYAEYEEDLNTFNRYGLSEKFFQEFLLFEKYDEQQISKCLNLLFSLNNSPLSAVSIFENILRAFDSAYYEKLKSLSPEFSHDASMRFLLEPVVQSLILIFEELHPEFRT